MHREINEKGPIALTALLLVVVILWGIFAVGKPAAAEEYRVPEAIRLEADVDYAVVEFRTSDFPDITAVYDKDHYDVNLLQEGTSWSVQVNGAKSKAEAEREPVVLYVPEFYCETFLLDAENSQLIMKELPSGCIRVGAWRSTLEVELAAEFTGGFNAELRSSNMMFTSLDGYQNSKVELRWEAPEETSEVIFPWFFEASEEEKNLYTYGNAAAARSINLTVKEAGEVVVN